MAQEDATAREADPTALSSRLFHLPKAELHVHLDGSLRPDTLLALAEERDVDLPASTAEGVAAHMFVSGAGSLEEYLERFATTLSVMQDAVAMERIAFELAEDCAAENVWYVEVRFCPLLHTKGDLSPDGAVEAALRGLARAERTFGIRTALIVCALRTHTLRATLHMAEVAVAWRGRGVAGFDIAGAEAGHPVSDHAAAFAHAAAHDVAITVHAGEGAGPSSIRQALDFGFANRIGHGTRLHEDRSLLEVVRQRGIPLEVCITSNVQTRAVPNAREHPARRYLMAGVPVTLSTDNRLMSGVSLLDEYLLARNALGCSWLELVGIARAGFEHAFLPTDDRRELLARFDAAVENLPPPPGPGSE